jgi:5-bromo-4-chloroindolyl phosphate hydrolysis protein
MNRKEQLINYLDGKSITNPKQRALWSVYLQELGLTKEDYMELKNDINKMREFIRESKEVTKKEQENPVDKIGQGDLNEIKFSDIKNPIIVNETNPRPKRRVKKT